MEFIVLEARNDGDSKVVEVLATIEGADGPSYVSQGFTFCGAERYKMDSTGKVWAKTGADYKTEIAGRISNEISPKALGPTQ